MKTVAQEKQQNQMYELVELWQSSKLRISQFCKKHELKPNAFRYWINKYEKQPPKSSGHFLEIKTPEVENNLDTSNTSIRINYPNGVYIELSPQTNLSLIKELIQL